MKSRHAVVHVVGLAVLALLIAGCSRGSGGSSGGSSGSSSSSSSSGSGTKTPPPGDTGSGGGGGQTAAASPTSPSLGTAYHEAALAYYYYYHGKKSIVWGDIGARYGHYDRDDYSTTLIDGYGMTWPDFTQATRFGDYLDSYSASSTYLGYITDATSCYTAIASTSTYPATATYSGAPGVTPTNVVFSGVTVTRAAGSWITDGFKLGDFINISSAEDVGNNRTAYGPIMSISATTMTFTYSSAFTTNLDDDTAKFTQNHSVKDIAGMTFTTGVYDFAGPGSYCDVRLQGTPSSPGILTLDGSSTDVFIFRMTGHLYVQGTTKIVLKGGVDPKNVYWRVPCTDTYGKYTYTYDATGHPLYYAPSGAWIGYSAGYPPYVDPALSGYSSFVGNILCNGDIVVGPGSSLTGRALTLNYGWWFYGMVNYGSISINATQPLAMGTSNDFALLAYDSITNTGETEVGGHVGVSTGTSPPRPPDPNTLLVSPPEWWYDDSAPESDTAITSAIAAKTDAVGRDWDYDLSGQKLQGKKLPPGVYIIDSTAFTGSKDDGPITLDGLNDPASCWIFRTSGTLDIKATGGVLQFFYERGANADNVFWVCGTANLATKVSFRGTIIASSASATAIKLESDATLQGRAITTAGSISCNSNVIFSNSDGGKLVWTQNSDPVTTDNDEAVSAANDGTNLYVFGFENGSSGDTSWRVEKRLLSTGDLVGSFGASGVVSWNPGGGNDIPRRIVVDGSSLYVFGSEETGFGTGTWQWHLEKRSLSTGALDPTFGSGAAIVSTLSLGGLAGDMAIEGTTLYLTGEMNDTYPFSSVRIRIEKRLTSTGDFDTSDSEFYSPGRWYTVPTLTGPTDPGYFSPGFSGPTTVLPSHWRPAYPGPDTDKEIAGAAWYNVPAIVDLTSPGYTLPGTSGLTTLPPGAWDPPYTGDPADMLVRDKTPVGVIEDNNLYSRGARCITLVTSPSTGSPFMLVGGWQDFGGIKGGLYQKRYLGTGRLDVAHSGVIPAYPGYGTGSGLGTQTIVWGFGGNIVESLSNDGTDSYALLSVDYAGAFYTPSFYTTAGYGYWVVEKRAMFGKSATDVPPDPGYSGGQLWGDAFYAIGAYGPVPYAENKSDFSPSSLLADGSAKRFWITACNTGTHGGEMWRIEKRKCKTNILDALFNTEGVRPGVLEEDPEPGADEIKEQWYYYLYETGAYGWFTDPPIGYPHDSYDGAPYHHIAPAPAVPGYPDRLRGLTMFGDKIYIVGSDCSDTGHFGRWRIECRNR